MDDHHSSGHPVRRSGDAAGRGPAPSPQPYDALPAAYHVWKWRILVAFCGFYLFIYLGRFAFWPLAPLIKEDLSLSHIEIGIINALLLWGFGLGDLVHGRLEDTEKLVQQLGLAIETEKFRHVQDHSHAIKGSARRIGAASLAICASQLHDTAHAGILIGLPALCSELSHEFELTKTALNKYLGKLDSAVL